MRTGTWLTVAACLLGAGLPQIGAAQTTDPDVSNYHADLAHSGKYVFPGLTPTVAGTVLMDTGFSARVNGNVYAQPLYWLPPGQTHGTVIVATMSNYIEAHDAVTGALVWSTHLGQDVASSYLPCGAQNPWGVAGTPVIDESTGTLYADGEILVNGSTPTHEIFGLSLATGKLLPGYPLTMDSAMAAAGYTDYSSLIQDQRGGLFFNNRWVYVAYGGHGYDCGNYHGWVVQITTGRTAGTTGHPAIAAAWETTGTKGGIWSPGGVSYDGSRLYVTTGNTYQASTWSDGEAVIQLGLNIAHSTDPTTYFAPTNWQSLDQTDKELGANNAVFLDVPSGKKNPYKWLFQIDKAGDVFIVSRTNLGGVGSGLLTLPTYLSANPPPRTAPAAYPAPDGSGVFVTFAGVANNCPTAANPNYLTTLKVSANTAGTPVVTTAWCASQAGALTVYPGYGAGAQADRGSPMVTTTDGTNNPVVWEEGTEGDNYLRAYDGVTGAELFNGGSTAMNEINRFSTALAVPHENRIYVAADSTLYSFTFPSGTFTSGQ